MLPNSVIQYRRYNLIGPNKVTHIVSAQSLKHCYKAMKVRNPTSLSQRFTMMTRKAVRRRKMMTDLGGQNHGQGSSLFNARPLLNQALENEDFEELVEPRLEHNRLQLLMFWMS